MIVTRPVEPGESEPECLLLLDLRGIGTAVALIKAVDAVTDAVAHLKKKGKNIFDAFFLVLFKGKIHSEELLSDMTTDFIKFPTTFF